MPQMADAPRKGPYQTNILLGGYDAAAGASLYFIDMYSSLAKVNFGVHGHASNFCLSIFDREWKVRAELTSWPVNHCIRIVRKINYFYELMMVYPSFTNPRRARAPRSLTLFLCVRWHCRRE